MSSSLLGFVFAYLAVSIAIGLAGALKVRGAKDYINAGQPDGNRDGEIRENEAEQARGHGVGNPRRPRKLYDARDAARRRD